MQHEHKSRVKLNELNAVSVKFKLRGEITVNKLKTFRSQNTKYEEAFNDIFSVQHAQKKDTVAKLNVPPTPPLENSNYPLQYSD